VLLAVGAVVILADRGYVAGVVTAFCAWAFATNLRAAASRNQRGAALVFQILTVLQMAAFVQSNYDVMAVWHWPLFALAAGVLIYATVDGVRACGKVLRS
jgi:hypothetical protein